MVCGAEPGKLVRIADAWGRMVHARWVPESGIAVKEILHWTVSRLDCLHQRDTQATWRLQARCSRPHFAAAQTHALELRSYQPGLDQRSAWAGPEVTDRPPELLLSCILWSVLSSPLCSMVSEPCKQGALAKSAARDRDRMLACATSLTLQPCPAGVQVWHHLPCLPQVRAPRIVAAFHSLDTHVSFLGLSPCPGC